MPDMPHPLSLDILSQLASRANIHCGSVHVQQRKTERVSLWDLHCQSPLTARFRALENRVPFHILKLEARRC